MKKTSILSALTIAIAFAGCSKTATVTSTDYTQYVNTFIGAADNGHTFPGACMPFGLIQTSPVTGAIGWRYCSEYVDTDSLIWGFTQTHLSGTGCMDLGDILVMPVTGERQRAWDGYRSRFEKSSESATPGYYTVELSDPNVKAEVTASIHAALHRYTFHNADSASLLIDLQHGPAWNEGLYHSHVKACEYNWEDEYTLTGHVNATVWVNRDYYFVMKFNIPVTEAINLPMLENEKAPRIVASFDMQPEGKLMMKVAMSTTGIEGAKKNMEAEVAEWDFDGIAMNAHNTWNSYLSRIEVTGTDDEKTNFYTSFYHALIQPNQISDVDGMFRNNDGQNVMADGGVSYSTNSLWDTYRAAHPFYTIMVPERVDGIVSSLIQQGEAQGHLPIWGLWGVDNYCMVANHGVAVVAEAYHKGFRGFDAERAFAIIKKGQTVSHKLKSDWETYMKYGYYPSDIILSESVSSTLENVYDDYAAADMAKLMGKTEDAEYFSKRAEFYKNLFDPSTKFMRPRLADGSWKQDFDPSQLAHSESRGGEYTEGNAWQYTWHVQHAIPELIEMMGGAEPFMNKLDSLFILNLEDSLADVSGLIGQYAHGNEPSHHVAYLYALAGRPERTQELIREIFDTQYRPKPDGLCGNDDCGQMSAWYMLSAMGFYPVDPVSGEFVFGAPQLPQIVLHLQNGNTFTVIADGISTEKKYVESITLNGEPYNKKYITYEDIMNGGTLVYKMKE